MGRKLVRVFGDVRTLRIENQDSAASRRRVAAGVLSIRDEFPDCKIKLRQQHGEPATGQIPDFTAECRNGQRWAIEIGRTGTRRKEQLLAAGLDVVHVRRGQEPSDWDKRLEPCRDCPYR